MSFWNKFPADRLLVDASLWSANLACLRDNIRGVDDFVDLYHFDVSDAHFTPGLLFFPDLVAALRPLTRKPFHVHLMVTDPLNLIAPFAQAGANLITVHAENDQAAAAIEQISALGLNAGLAFCLETPIERGLPLLKAVDLVLLMGTALGVKGQELSPLACQRIQSMQNLLMENSFAGKIKVAADGGIRQHTVPVLRAAGADLIVAGSLIFKSDDVSQTIAWLHHLPDPKGFKNP
jgi:ribulose-phosphate 3-epimerase